LRLFASLRGKSNCRLRATTMIANENAASWSNNPTPPHLDHAELSTAGYKSIAKSRKTAVGPLAHRL